MITFCLRCFCKENLAYLVVQITNAEPELLSALNENHTFTVYLASAFPVFLNLNDLSPFISQCLGEDSLPRLCYLSVAL